MDWNAALQTLGTMSPVIGTAVGGPVGTAVGLGIKGLVSLITGKSDPAEAVQVLQANPDKLVDLEIRTRELENDALKAALADRQNARQSMVQLAQAGSKESWAPAVISAIVLLGFFACMWKLFYVGLHDLEPVQADLLKTLFGALIPMASGVVAYWVGSTNGSHGKDQIIGQSVPMSALSQLSGK